MRNPSDLPRPLAGFLIFNHVALLGGAAALLLRPELSEALSLHVYSAPILAFLLALNALVLGLSTAALKFKFGEHYFSGWAVGIAWSAVSLTALLDGWLVWEVLAQNRVHDKAWLFTLALPASALGLIAIRLGRDRKPVSAGGMKATDIVALEHEIDEEPEAEPEPAPIEKRPLWLRIANYPLAIAPWAFMIFLGSQLALIGAGLTLAIGTVLRQTLVLDGVVAPRNMPDFISNLTERASGPYIEFALAILKWSAIYVGAMIVALPIMLLLMYGLFALFGWIMSLFQPRLFKGLSEQQAADRDEALEHMVGWFQSQPKVPGAPWISTLHFVASIFLTTFGLVIGGGIITEFVSTQLYPLADQTWRDRTFYVSAAAAFPLGFAAAVLWATAGYQSIPGLKQIAFSQIRTNLEHKPFFTTNEWRATIESALVNGWYDFRPPFDPEAFHRRWVARTLNGFRTTALISAPILAVLVAWDAMSFRAWTPTEAHNSGRFEITVAKYAYADANAVETDCVIYTDDGERKTRQTYAVVFEGNQRFETRLRVTSSRMDEITPIHSALLAAGVPFERGENASECYALLRGRYGTDAERMINLLEGR